MDKDQYISIRWTGRGRRVLGTKDGMSQDYIWPAMGATAPVHVIDALEVATLSGFEFAEPADERRAYALLNDDEASDDALGVDAPSAPAVDEQEDVAVYS